MAAFLGYRVPYFSGIINGKERLSDKFLKEISELLHINKDWVLSGEGDMFSHTITQTVTGDKNAVSGIGNITVHGGTDPDMFLKELEAQRRLTEIAQAQMGKAQEQIDRLLGIIEKYQK